METRQKTCDCTCHRHSILCVCGKPNIKEVIHREDGPCYYDFVPQEVKESEKTHRHTIKYGGTHCIDCGEDLRVTDVSLPQKDEEWEKEFYLTYGKAKVEGRLMLETAYYASIKDFITRLLSSTEARVRKEIAKKLRSMMHTFSTNCFKGDDIGEKVNNAGNFIEEYQELITTLRTSIK